MTFRVNHQQSNPMTRNTMSTPTVTIDTNSLGDIVARDDDGNAVAVRSSDCNPAALAQIILDVDMRGYAIDWDESTVAQPTSGHGDVYAMSSGAYIRPATADEAAASIAAAERDGGVGVIFVCGRACFVR